MTESFTDLNAIEDDVISASFSATLLPTENYERIYKLSPEEEAVYDLPPPLPSPRLLPVEADTRVRHCRLNSAMLTDCAVPAQRNIAPEEALRTATVQTISNDPALALPLTLPYQLQHASSAQELPFATGEDVINYFVRFGSDTVVKFAHLVQAEGPEYRPYDLSVVELDEHCKEYYTISPAGVFFTCPGQLSECTTLAKWVRDSTMFTLLRSIRFFKHYLHRKVFQIWKDNVRQRLFIKQRKKVADNLFHNRDTCAQPILELQRYMLELHAVNLVQFDIRMPSDIVKFVDVQQEQCARATATFDDIFRRFADKTQAVVTEINDLTWNDEEEAVSLFELQSSGGLAARNKSLVRLKQERIEKRMAKFRAILERKSLPEFIRFCDYIAVEALVARAIASAQRLHQELIKVRKSGLFETVVHFSDEGEIVYSPHRGETLAALDGILELIISTVSNVNRVIYLHNTAVSGPNIVEIIRANEEFVQLEAQIRDKVNRDYDVAAEYALTFHNVRPIFEFNRTWNYDEYRKVLHDSTELRQTINTVAGWYRELDKMRNKCIGALEIDSKKLKAELIPLRAARLHEIKEYLVETARDQCQKTIADFKDVTQKLQLRPTKLHEFAAQMQVLEDIQNRSRELVVHGAQVQDMYQIMQAHDVPTPSQDVVAFESLTEKQDEYREELDKALTFREGRLPEMAHALHINVFKLNETVSGLSSNLQHEQYTTRRMIRDPALVLDRLGALRSKVTEATNTANMYGNYQRLFGLALYSFADVNALQDKYDTTERLWNLVHQWQQQYQNWGDSEFGVLNATAIQQEVDATYKEAFKLHDTLSSAVTEWLRNSVGEFKGVVPCLLRLKSDALKSHHWELVFRVVKLPYVSTATFTLAMLVNNHIADHVEEITQIVSAATREHELNLSLQQISSFWAMAQFSLQHKVPNSISSPRVTLPRAAPSSTSSPPAPQAYSNCLMLKDTSETHQLLDDHLLRLHTMLDDPDLGSIDTEVRSSIEQLQLIQELLYAWMLCQEHWSQLGQIFRAEDLQRQLPTEFQQFKAVDQSHRALTSAVAPEPSILRWIDPKRADDSLLASLNKNCELLEQVKRSVHELLVLKRAVFPHLHFISDADLFELYANSSSTALIVQSVRKVLPAIQHLEFVDVEGNLNVVAVGDGVAEILDFNTPCALSGHPEIWMKQLHNDVRALLAQAIEQAHPMTRDPSKARPVLLHPRQAAAVVNQIAWTNDLEDVIRQGGIGEAHALHPWLRAHLQIIQSLSNRIGEEELAQERLLLSEMITLAVCIRDVAQHLSHSLDDLTLDHFNWQAQLRYYRRPDIAETVVRISTFSSPYSHEYYGNAPVLIVEPITDRCYLALVRAFRSCNGIVMSGPCQSGRASSVRSLSTALGMFCHTHWCSAINSPKQVIERLCVGIAQVGGWLCLKAASKLPQDVSSVLQHCLSDIMNGLRQSKRVIDVHGRSVALRSHVGVVLTTAAGDGKWTNLTSGPEPGLFRNCAVIAPSVFKIAEGICLWYGMQDARTTAAVLQSLADMLNESQILDCRISDIKHIISDAVALKVKSKGRDSTSNLCWILQAVQLMLKPRLTLEQLATFECIIAACVPHSVKDLGSTSPIKSNYATQSSFQDWLLLSDLWFGKLRELQHIFSSKRPAVLLGSSGTGKTTAIELTIGDLKRPGIARIFSAALSVVELYGQWNEVIQQWEDGVLAATLRTWSLSSVHDTLQRDENWIILDGPIDPTVCDSLGPWLDSSSNAISFGGNKATSIITPAAVRLMFETTTLANSSPQFVSRCGVVSLPEDMVTWRSLLHSWEVQHQKSKRLARAHWQQLGQQMQALLPDCFQQYQQAAEQAGGNGFCFPERYLTSNLLLLLSRWLEQAQLSSHPQTATALDTLLAWAMSCTIAATLPVDARARFQVWLFSVFERCQLPPTLDTYTLDPKTLTLVECDVGNTQAYTAAPMNSRLPSEVYIETAERHVLKRLVRQLSTARKSVLILGAYQGGKSTVLQSMLRESSDNGRATALIGCSHQTQRAEIKAALRAKLVFKGRAHLGTQGGIAFDVFMDDIAFVQAAPKSSHGASELLRHILESGCIYQGVELSREVVAASIHDIAFISTMNQTTARERSDEMRSVRHFCTLGIAELNSNQLRQILVGVASHCASHQNVGAQFVSVISALTNATIEVHQKLQLMIPTPPVGYPSMWFGLHEMKVAILGACTLIRGTGHMNVPAIWRHEMSKWIRGRLSGSVQATFDELLQEAQPVCSSPKDLVPHTEPSEFFHPHCLSAMKQLGASLTDEIVALRLAVESYQSTHGIQLAIPFCRSSFYHLAHLLEILAEPHGNVVLRGSLHSQVPNIVHLAAHMANRKIRNLDISALSEGSDTLVDVLETIIINAEGVVCLIADPKSLDLESIKLLQELRIGRACLPKLLKRPQILQLFAERSELATTSQKHDFVAGKLCTGLRFVTCLPDEGVNPAIVRPLLRLCRRDNVDCYSNIHDKELREIARSLETNIDMTEVTGSANVREGLVELVIAVHRTLWAESCTELGMVAAPWHCGVLEAAKFTAFAARALAAAREKQLRYASEVQAYQSACVKVHKLRQAETKEKCTHESATPLQILSGHWERLAANADPNIALAGAVLAEAYVSYLAPIPEWKREIVLEQWAKLCFVLLEINRDMRSVEEVIAATHNELRTLLHIKPGQNHCTVLSSKVARDATRVTILLDAAGQSCTWLTSWLGTQAFKVVTAMSVRFWAELSTSLGRCDTVLLLFDNTSTASCPTSIWWAQLFRLLAQHANAKLYVAIQQYSSELLTDIPLSILHDVEVVNIDASHALLIEGVQTIVAAALDPMSSGKHSKVVTTLEEYNWEQQRDEAAILQILNETDLEDLSSNPKFTAELEQLLDAVQVRSQAIESCRTELMEFSAKIEAFQPLASRIVAIFKSWRMTTSLDTSSSFSFDRCMVMTRSWLQKQQPLSWDDKVHQYVKFDVLAVVAELSLFVFRMVTTSLPMQHLAVFKLLLAVHIVNESNPVGDSEWKCLHAIIAKYDQSSGQSSSAAADKLFDPTTLNQVAELEQTIQCFQGLSRDMELRVEVWTRHFKAAHVETLSLPSPWNNKLSSVQRLLTWLVLCPHSSADILHTFVAAHLGSELMPAMPFTLADVANITCPDMPVIVLTGDANQFVVELEQLAAERGVCCIDNTSTNPNCHDEKVQEQWLIVKHSSSEIPFNRVSKEETDAKLPREQVRQWFVFEVGSEEHLHEHRVRNAMVYRHQPQRELRNAMVALVATTCDGDGPFLPPTIVAATFVHRVLQTMWHQTLHSCSTSFSRWGITQFKDVCSRFSTLHTLDVHSIWAHFMSVYGATMTNMWERRVLGAAIRRALAFCDFASNTITLNEAQWPIPFSGDRDETIEYCKAMPANFILPETFYFGHSSATPDLSMLSVALSTVAKPVIPTKIEAIVAQLLEQLPAQFGDDELASAEKNSHNKAMWNFLTSEASHWNRQASCIKSDLRLLQDWMRNGSKFPDTRIIHLTARLRHGHVPPSWSSTSQRANLLLIHWLQRLVQQLAQLSDWIKTGVAPKPVHIGHVFRPHALIAALKQQTALQECDFATAHPWYIHSQILRDCEKDANSPGPGALQIHGLHLRGAVGFDRNHQQLIDGPVTSTCHSLTPLPCILIWASKEPPTPNNTFKCPLFIESPNSSNDASNFVLELELSSSKPEDHWLLRGCVAVCKED